MVVWAVQLDNRRHDGGSLVPDWGVTKYWNHSPISNVESIVTNFSTRYVRLESPLPCDFQVALRITGRK